MKLPPFLLRPEPIPNKILFTLCLLFLTTEIATSSTGKVYTYSDANLQGCSGSYNYDIKNPDCDHGLVEQDSAFPVSGAWDHTWDLGERPVCTDGSSPPYYPVHIQVIAHCCGDPAQTIVLFDGSVNSNDTVSVKIPPLCQSLDDYGDPGSCQPESCCAMPRYSVSDYLSVWIHDEPLGYQPAAGPRISFRLGNKQRDEASGLNPKIFGVGKRWSFSWLSYVALDSNGSNRVHFPDSRERTFFGPQDYLTNTRLTGDTNTGFTVSYPDGSKDVYGFIVNDGSAFSKAFMSEHWNTPSQKTTLYYTNWTTGPVTRLLYVVDGDGRTNKIYYVGANAYSTNLISQVVDPFGRTNFLDYNSDGHLTTVVDVEGITNSFGYDGNERVNSMTTPYGTTSFGVSPWASDGGPANYRSVLVTLPDGGHELYLSRDGSGSVSSSYPTNEVPNTYPFSNTFDNVEMNFHDVFHWGPRQYANLSNTTIASFTVNDWRKARLRHFLRASTNFVSRTLSMERDPSPDAAGSIEGQKTWYDYAGKTNAQFEGTQSLPLSVARVLLDGTTWFNRTERNSYGNVTTNVSTFSVGGSIYLRTNILTYSSDGIDLLTSTNADGVQVSSNYYNADHQVLTNYNALGEITAYTYDPGSHLVTSITKPTGLITTNIYNGSGQLTSTYDYTTVGGTVYYRTNSYTYANDLVLTHTDERGLTTTYTYDNLQRTTNASDSRGSIKYTYDKLDLVKVVDRMGFTNTFAYDSMRRKVGETNALGYHTSFSYCSCGSLDSIQDAAGNSTYFFYDNQGRLVNTTNADSFGVSNNYSLLGQLTNTIDSARASVTNSFNNQGLLVSSGNAYGQVQATTYDALDRATNSTDANGVTVVSTYDNLNRLRTRTYPDSGVEAMGYSADTAALTSYTNQIGNATKYFYDPLGRKVAETNANPEGIEFTYTPGSDLLTLTDGKGQTTSWNYDQFGRATNKLDQASAIAFIYQYDSDNRLTDRWTPQKGNTSYAYDAVGNLTNIHYPVSSNISMAYDMLNRMTNMVDGLGTTKRTYDPVGQLLTEDGPMANDTLTSTYTNRLRLKFSLQQPADVWTNAFAYDAAKRLTNVASPAGSFGYHFISQPSTLISQLNFPNGSRITNAFDMLARLTNSALKTSGNSVLDSYAYIYDPANQRTNLTRADASTVAYRYDNIGQLKVADSSVNSEDRGYKYDSAWNLNYRTNNGSLQTFTVDGKNQLTAQPSGSCAYDLNGNLTNNAGLLYVYDDENRLISWSQGPPTNGALASSFVYDGLGRLRSRGEFLGNGSTWVLQSVVNYIYDGLRVIQERDADNNPQVSYTRGLDLSGTLEGAGGIGGLLARSHDFLVCTNVLAMQITNESPVSIIVSIYDNSQTYLDSLSIQAWSASDEFSFSAVGGNLYTVSGTSVSPYTIPNWSADFTAVLDHDLYTVSVFDAYSHTWSGNVLCGLDQTGQWLTHNYYFADGNGNVTSLETTNETLSASYRYDPFGNITSKSGGLADANTLRFSSKEYMISSDVYSFGERFYAPLLQRWPNQDPVREHGGVNLYTYIGNDPVAEIDPVGLDRNHNSVPSGATLTIPAAPLPSIYNPTFWNDDPSRRANNNCYNYACDKPTGDFKAPGGDWPRGTPVTCPLLIARVKADGGKDPDKCGNCPEGMHKIRLWAALSGADFHFFRQDWNGLWSDKPGEAGARPRRDPTVYGGPSFAGDSGNIPYLNCGNLCVPNQPIPH